MSCAQCTIVSKETGEGEVGRKGGRCFYGGCIKRNSFDWLDGITSPIDPCTFVEVRFKNERKEFYKNADRLSLQQGDNVVVDTKLGYDVGIVSMTGELVERQMRAKGINPVKDKLYNIMRKATREDVSLWQKAREREADAILWTRRLVEDHHKSMKISDIEFQGDNTKTTIFYTSDDRVDFRDITKLIAREFQTRIEMRQIGVRQEAGKSGAIGSCGRDVCCSTWLTDFVSVNTSSARIQQLSLNPANISGQCGKLKCCLNYELKQYIEAGKDFPKQNIKLKTEEGIGIYQKADFFSKLIWYAYKDSPDIFIPITLDNVKKIIAMNKEGKKPVSLKEFALQKEERSPVFENAMGEGNINRFDKLGKKKHKRKKRNNRKR